MVNQNLRIRWSNDRIQDELSALCKKCGHFPTKDVWAKESKWGLYGAIRANGGIKYWATRVGAERIHTPAHYWNWKRVKVEVLKLEKKFGRMPSQTEYGKMKLLPLYRAMQKYGGSYKVALKLGIEPSTKQREYWTLENTINALLPLARTVGSFPNKTQLEKLHKGRLSKHIHKNGGIVHVALSIKRLIKKGTLDAKWLFASRLSYGGFLNLRTTDKQFLIKQDPEYYKRIVGLNPAELDSSGYLESRRK